MGSFLLNEFLLGRLEYAFVKNQKLCTTAGMPIESDDLQMVYHGMLDKTQIRWYT